MTTKSSTHVLQHGWEPIGLKCLHKIVIKSMQSQCSAEVKLTQFTHDMFLCVVWINNRSCKLNFHIFIDGHFFEHFMYVARPNLRVCYASVNMRHGMFQRKHTQAHFKTFFFSDMVQDVLVKLRQLQTTTSVVLVLHMVQKLEVIISLINNILSFLFFCWRKVSADGFYHNLEVICWF